MAPMSKLVSKLLRPDGQRDPDGVAEAKPMLDTAYGWLDGVMARRTGAEGDGFSVADCAAAPALFYADWAHRIGEAFPLCGAIAPVYSPVHRSRAPWTRRGPIAPSFRSARPTGTDG